MKTLNLYQMQNITANGDGQDLETPIWNTDPEVYFLDFDKVAWKLHDVVS